MKAPPLIVILLLLVPRPAPAQTLDAWSHPAPALVPPRASEPLPPEALRPPPPVGMAPWAYRLALAVPIANVALTELAYARYGVYTRGVPRRAAVEALNLALPIAVHWALRGTPRATANGQAVVIAAWAGFDLGRTVRVLVTVPIP